jgi:glycosyltransferase involved in cell wall biosynthesis
VEPLHVVVPVFSLRKTGGVERYTWCVAGELAQRGHDVTVLAPNGSRLPRPHGTKGASLGRRQPSGTVGTALALTTFGRRASRRLRRSFPEALAYGPVGSHARTPGVVTAHSVHAAWVERMQRDLGRSPSQFDRVLMAIERAAFGTPGLAITTVSSRCAEEISRLYGVDRSSIAVIPPAVDPEDFPIPGADERERARRALGVESGPLVVGIVANYTFDRKGVATLAAACARVGAVLLIAGVPHPRERRQLVTGSDADVRILGALSDMRSFYAALDVFALPSLYEPYGMAADEALASGLPTVVSDRTGISERLADGEEAVIVPSGDVESLEAAIESLRDPELRARLGAAGAVWARRRGWADVAQELEARLVATAVIGG